MPIRRRSTGRHGAGRRFACLLVLVLAAFATTATAALANGQVEIVTQGAFPTEGVPKKTHYFHKIQEAVDATTTNDWVLIEPGIYEEEVKVEPPHHKIWIRGMDRNGVILDGSNINTPGSNGIEVKETNNVWIENLTVRNFEEHGGGGGNEIWWNGGAESGRVKAHGWYGAYLTAYVTGLEGAYGIFTGNETLGQWNHVYASGFNDSGLYLGACQECRALINDATMENNSLGYSGSNSGGQLIFQNSVFRHNFNGMSPDGENPGDPPPPNDGQCGRHNIAHPNPTPHFTTTQIERCEIYRHNLFAENDNKTAPENGSTEIAAFGVGMELAGDYAYNVENNTFENNPTDGILAHEYPNPYPPTEQTIYFQNAGNRFAENTFVNNGAAGGAYAGDFFLEGGIFGMGKSQSTMDCVENNHFADASFPAEPELQETWGCQNATTPNPNLGIGGLEWVVFLSEEGAAIREPKGQPAPAPQATMPQPCEGVPSNPLCP